MLHSRITPQSEHSLRHASRPFLSASAITLLLTMSTSVAAADGTFPKVADDVQTASNGDGGALETVTVTARKRKEDVQDVPIGVTAVDGRQLADKGATQIQQLQFLAPSLVVDVPNPRQVSISIRGVGNNPAADGLSASVGLYIDGIYLDRPGMANFDMLDIEQVEVLRGPQGTLFGKNTTAGAISFTTLAPTFDWQFNALASLGDYQRQQFQASVSGPISDTVAFRLAAYSEFREGYLKDVYDGANNLGLDRQGLRGQLLVRPNDDLTWRLIFEADHEDDSSSSMELYNKGPSTSANPKFVSYQKWASNLGITPVFDPNALENDQNGVQRQIEHQYSGTSLVDWNVDGFTLSSLTGYRYWSFLPHNDFDWTYADVIRNQGASDYEREFSQEFRIVSPTGGAIDYVAGLYYFWRGLRNNSFSYYGSEYSVGLGNPKLAPLNDGHTITHGDISTNAYAAYAQGTWHIIPKWNLTLGYRETYEIADGWVERDAFAGGTGTPPLNVAPYPKTAISNGSWTPSALSTLDYKASDNTLVYGTVSYGEKAGGFNSPTVPQSSTGVIQAISTLKVSPEKALDYEVGVKNELCDHRLILNADAYWTEIYDYQANTQLPTSTGALQSVIANVGAVRARGVELEATALPIDELRLDASVGYNDAVYQKFKAAPAIEGSVAATQILTGRPVVQSPHWTINAGGTYAKRIADGIDGYLGVDVSYKSSEYGYIDDSPYSLVHGYTLVNLRVGTTFGDGRYDFSAWVRNLGDARYFYMVFPAATGSGGYFGIPAEPRMFGVTLKAAL